MRNCVETIPHFSIVYQYVIDISSELYGHQLFHCQSACALDELAGPVLCEFTETSIDSIGINVPLVSETNVPPSTE